MGDREDGMKQYLLWVIFCLSFVATSLGMVMIIVVIYYTLDFALGVLLVSLLFAEHSLLFAIIATYLKGRTE